MTYVAKTYKDGKLVEVFFQHNGLTEKGQNSIREVATKAMREQKGIDKVMAWSPVGKAS